jgi:hypothetical protein
VVLILRVTEPVDPQNPELEIRQTDRVNGKSMVLLKNAPEN